MEEKLLDNENEENKIEEKVEEYIPKYRYADAKSEFEKFNLRFNMRSVVYLKNKGLSFTDLIEYNEYNVIPFIASGISDKTKQTNEIALDMIDGWLDKGYTLKELFILTYEQAKINGFFMSTDEVLFLTEMMELTPDSMSKAVIYSALIKRQELKTGKS